MTDRTLTERVTILEQTVEDLAVLPARVAGVELQIVQLRDEMRLGFSAVRQEMAGLREDLLDTIRHGDDAVRGELHAEMRELRSEMQRLREELRGEIREGDQETRRYMRVLHEDVIARIAALGDARR
jgi:phosphoglycerate-specific signal transduction histidine kinase